ncbi:hypothetical protein NLI96_g6260 [Meripilus lineatus]|uniref:AB hydrolase-1 domain-containing protein n=1 Tax=Meripilus lineatus TaxID=2056292 RepID=A0AAD5V1D7_9APHY|nr:hypothetical protein NLI96_g6260 [Physisporinus lineatus]
MAAQSTEFPAPVRPSAESLPLESSLRQLYPDDIYPNGKCAYFASPNGRVRYWIVGPTEGAQVVLIHGISAPSIGYQNITAHLVEQGFRVLLYDLHGRGYSEITKTPSDVNLYTIQLALLLQYVGWHNAYIVGFSMVKPAQLRPSSDPNSLPLKVGSAPFLTLILALQSLYQIRELQAKAFRGYQQLIQHDLRFGPITGLEVAFKALASPLPGKKEPLRVLIVHGTEDDIVPFTEAAKIQAAVPQAQLVKIEGANHFLVFQEGYWQQVAESISKFLS